MDRRPPSHMNHPNYNSGYTWPANYYDYGRPAGDYDYNYHPQQEGYYHPGPAGSYHTEVKVYNYGPIPPYEYHQHQYAPPPPMIPKYDYLGHSPSSTAKRHAQDRPSGHQKHTKQVSRPADDYSKKHSARGVPSLGLPTSDYNYHQEALLSSRSEATGRESKDQSDTADRKTSRIFVGGLATSVSESRFVSHPS